MVEQESRPRKQLSRRELFKAVKYMLEEYGPVVLFSLLSFTDGVLVEDTFDLVRRRPGNEEESENILAYFSEKDIAEGYEVVMKVVRNRDNISEGEVKETDFLNVFTVNFSRFVSQYLERTENRQISATQRTDIIKLLINFQDGLNKVLGQLPDPSEPNFPLDDSNI